MKMRKTLSSDRKHIIMRMRKKKKYIYLNLLKIING